MKNIAQSSGGGLYLSFSTSHNPNMSNLTITGNRSFEGAGFSKYGNGSLNLKNSIIWENFGTYSEGKQIWCSLGSVTMTNSCYPSGTALYGSISSVSSVQTDPLLADPLNGDLRLTASSPCLDAGNDTYNNEPYDIRGIGFGRKLLKTDYTQTGTIDMGAYEFNSNTDPVTCVNPTDGGTIAGAQTICYNADPTAFTSTTLPTGHTGTLEYKWQYSTSDSPYSWIDIASSNSEVYDASSLTQTIWFRRLARVDCESDWSGAAESNVLEVTVIALPTVTGLNLDPDLDITHFANYELSVDVAPNGNTIDDVTFVIRPQTASATNMNWDFYTNGVPFPNPNVPLEETATNTSGNAWSFSQLRPDNIYSEIAFIFDIKAAPSNSRFWGNSYQLMRFTNNYDITPGTSFFIELYATPVTTSPPSADLQVYLVGEGFNISAFEAGGPFANQAWQTHASVELVGTINRNDPFHHNHGPNSSHFLIPLSADANGKIGNKALDISDNFWIILTTGNQLQQRGWDMKFHAGCNNNSTWYKGSGTTFALQNGCPDVHVHFAREEATPAHNTMEVKVAVNYTYSSQTCQFESTPETYSFAELPNLPPNASAFTAPAPGTYQNNVTISWLPATDPNNDAVTYNVYLIDLTGTPDTITVATGLTGTSYVLSTITYDNADYDILVEACDAEFCTGFDWSSNIDVTEFFRILNCNLVAGAITAGTGQTICSGATPSVITADPPTGGNGTYDYQWQQFDGSTWISVTGGSNATTLSYTPPALTTTTRYRLQKTDTWCDPDAVVETAEVEVTVSPLPTFTYTKTDITCFNAGDGKIEMNAAGGSGSGYEYRINNGSSWTPWQSGGLFQNLSPGTYTLEVKDGNGCVQVDATP